MLKHLTLLSVALLFSISSFAQKSYTASAGEMIFSYGDVESDSADITPVVRWSPFFNIQQQVHFNFSEHVGIYTGLGVRNVGLISHIMAPFVTDTSGTIVNKEVTVKERSYSLGIPLALKLGNVEGGAYFTIGGEAEIMFAWKRKIMEGDGKQKEDAWFDDHVNIFNPSAFAEVHFAKGQYIRIKYYLMDFLNYQGIQLVDENLNKTYVADYGPGSPLFYISIGSVSLKRSLGKSSGSEDANKKPTQTTFFKSKENDPNWNSSDVALTGK